MVTQCFNGMFLWLVYCPTNATSRLFKRLKMGSRVGTFIMNLFFIRIFTGDFYQAVK